MLYKSNANEIKDLDEEKGIVRGFANYYNNEDSDGDISMPGSFKKTVKEQKDKIRVFKDHNRFKLLGVPLEIDADNPEGLLTTTKFNMNKAMSKDMFMDIKLITENGQDADMSVGVIPKQRDEQNKSKVLQWKLREYSFLSSYGSNSEATVQSIKGRKDYKHILNLIEQAYDLDYSDKRLASIEKTLQALEAGNDHFEPPEPSGGAGNDHSNSELEKFTTIFKNTNNI